MSKLVTALKHPRRAAQKAIYYATERRSRARIERSPLSGLLTHLRHAVNGSAFRPQFTELLRLYNFVRERKPQVVWEFGSGWSTAFIAQALKDNRAGKLLSVESDAEWMAHTRSMLPHHLAPHVELRHSPVSKVSTPAGMAWAHACLPEAVPQMIYLDGPPLTEDCRGCADIPAIEERLATGCFVVIDGRTKTVAMLRRALKREWSASVERGPFGAVFHQTMMELKH